MRRQLKWTDEYIRSYVENLVKRDNIKREDIPNLFKAKYLYDNGLSTPFVSRFHNNRYAFVNFVFPNMFTEEEFKTLTKRKKRSGAYWTKENFKKHIEEMIEYEGLHIDDIPRVISARYLIGKGFAHPLSKYTDGSPYETFEIVYPNRFKKEEFIKWSKIRRTQNIIVPSKEETIKRVRENISTDLRMSIDDIPKEITYNDIIKLGIEKPFRKYFNSSFYKLFDAVFPNRFIKSDFNDKLNKRSYKVEVNKKRTAK